MDEADLVNNLIYFSIFWNCLIYLFPFKNLFLLIFSLLFFSFSLLRSYVSSIATSTRFVMKIFLKIHTSTPSKISWKVISRNTITTLDMSSKVICVKNLNSVKLSPISHGNTPKVTVWSSIFKALKTVSSLIHKSTHSRKLRNSVKVI